MRLRHMNNIFRRALLSALLGLAIPLFASSPEYLVGGTVPAPAPSIRNAPAVATDGTDFFVVWNDHRSGSSTVIGTRVKRTGQVLDPLGIRIADAGLVLAPHVVWDGGAYLVTWTGSAFANGTWTSRNVFAARVDRDGRIVMAPRVIAENASTSSGRYAASNGSISVVVYRGDAPASSPPLRTVVLDREGNTIRHEQLVPNYVYSTGFSITATANRFLVVWSANPTSHLNNAKVEAVALGADGRVLGTPVTVASGDDAAVATDGTRFTIVFRKWSWADHAWSLAARTVDADLTQLGAIQPLANEHVIEYLSLLWRGDRYEAIAGVQKSGGGPYTIESIELDREGHEIATRSRDAVDFTYVGPELFAATNGADLLVAQTAQTGNSTTQIVARLYAGSASAQTHLLSWSGNAHANPAVAASASGQLVVWTEEQGGVYATRMDRNGNSLDGRGIRISALPGHARAAFDGTNYVVAWTGAGIINVRYIAPATGATVAEAQIPASVWQGLELETSPEATFVVYEEQGSIRVARIPHATHTPDPSPLTVSPDDLLSANPTAAWNGSHLLIAWTEEYFIPRANPPIPLSIRIHAARVTGGLSLLDPSPILLAETNSEEDLSSFGPPSLASNGEDWLLVTTHDATDVLARRVLRSGMAEGNAPTKIAQGLGSVVAWDGVRYVVAWYQGPDTARELPLMVAAIPANGALVATRRSLAARNATSPPSLARAADGEVALAYTKVSFLPEHTGVPRSYLRLIDLASQQRGRVVRR